ncbi:MAG TPA: hypothetical protein VG994_12320 [Steroidobacteraceae bacterium]|nr:hypothetical protein [Steroidobacteraceae bacterium]
MFGIALVRLALGCAAAGFGIALVRLTSGGSGVALGMTALRLSSASAAGITARMALVRITLG